MDVLCDKRCGCSDIYDKDFLRRDESGGFCAKNGQNLYESGGFFAKKGQNLDFSAKLARIQPYSCVKGIEFIKFNGENSGALFSITGFVVRA